MGETETSSGNPKAKVEVELVKHDDSTVVIYIGDAPIEVRQKRMAGTFEKLVAIIDKNQQ